MAALELVHRHDLDEIEDVLRSAGVRDDLVWKLTLLIPSAFAAARYEPEGIEFPTHFQVGSKSELRSLPYSGEAAYVEARKLADRWIAEGRHSFVSRILDWSAEAKGINQAIEQGLTPTRMASVHHGDVW
ncbi:hypothetical protein ENE75_24360 [Rubrivivax albus]|uniref:Uncharacterized protein n=2 Tax=Rubrivivax albus TaxID=2499835 RepID=A0A437JKN1_9BURK|nr:hypothetical protein ENE75_24360 [Rubrivivax albus]